MALRNAFEDLATEATLADILAALSGQLQTRHAYAAPVAWDGSEKDVSNFAEVEFSFGTMTGGPWVPQRKMTADADWQDWPAKDSMDASVTSIDNANAGKIYRMRGRGLIRLEATSGTLVGVIQEA